MTEVTQDAPLSNAEKMVYGADAKRGPDGKIIEQGFGSVSRKSSKIMALEKDAEDAAKASFAKLEERAKTELANAKADEQSIVGKVVGAIKNVAEDF
jgi:hypothetical protein